MHSSDFIVFLTALGIAAATPGPGLAAVVATTFEGGGTRAFWFCLGVVSGDLVWLSLSLHGLALIAMKIPILFMIIKWSGVLYLLVLAVRLWRSTSVQRNNAPAHSKNLPMASGFAITMGNPKAMLFYLSLLPSIVDTNVVTTSMTLLLSAAVVGILSLVLCIYVFFALRARAVLSSHQSSGRMNRLTSIVLAGAATWVAVK